MQSVQVLSGTLRDRTMTDKLMYMMIHKITLSVHKNWWLKRLNTQLNESTNQNSLKSSKLLRKRYYKNLGTNVINIKHPFVPTISVFFHIKLTNKI